MKKLLTVLILLVVLLGSTFATSFILEPGAGFVFMGGKYLKQTKDYESIRSTMFNINLKVEGELDNHIIIYDISSLGFPGYVREKDRDTNRFEKFKTSQGFLLGTTIGAGYAFHFNDFRLALGVGAQADVLTYKVNTDEVKNYGMRESVGVSFLVDFGYMFNDWFGLSLSTRPSIDFYSAERRSGRNASSMVLTGGQCMVNTGAELNCIFKF